MAIASPAHDNANGRASRIGADLLANRIILSRGVALTQINKWDRTAILVHGVGLTHVNAHYETASLRVGFRF
jgi:hypothetical protein